MSSLAKQLKQLQVPRNLVGPATKKQSNKASLLFDGRQAADIDNDTIFSLATNGLEELKAIEQAFATFQESLFSQLSKKMERSLQTKEFNERLDKQISQFLKFLSPYFLLKPAHKTLEWLIRRYRIHISNEDALMYCVLPYHETNLFVRVVQLLKVRNPTSKWHWLEPLQKSGSPLAKTTLLQKCVSDLTFLNEICEMVPGALDIECPASSLRVVFTFYASTVVGALEIMDRASEEIITRLLPYIVMGVKSGIGEHMCASYMIIAQLCNKCILEEALVKSLLEAVCKSLSVHLAKEGLMCITIMCSTQSRHRLHKKAFKHLMSVQGIANHICQLAAICDIMALVKVLLPQLVSAVVKTSCEDSDEESHLADCLYTLAKELEMDKWVVKLLARALLEEYCKARNNLLNDMTHIKQLDRGLKPLAQYLEKRYPMELENVLEEYLEELKSAQDEDEETAMQHSQWTLDFMSLALSGFKFQVVPDLNATLMLSLHHPKSDVRKLAVNRLCNLVKKEKLSQGDSDFVSEALLARLGDDDVSVVDSVLNMGQLLIQSVPSEPLVEKLLALLDPTNWNEQCDQAVMLLTSFKLLSTNTVLLDKIVYGLLPLLFLDERTHKHAVGLSRKLAQTKLIDTHFQLQDIKMFVQKKEWTECETSSNPDVLAAGNRILIGWLGGNLASLPQDQLLEKVVQFSKYPSNHPSDQVCSLLLNCIVGKLVATDAVATNMDVIEAILAMVLSNLDGVEKLKGKHVPVEVGRSQGKHELSMEGVVPLQFISEFITHLAQKNNKKTERAKASICLWLLGNIIRSLAVMDSVTQGPWWDIKDDMSPEMKYTKILLSVFEVLVHGAYRAKPTALQSIYKQLMQEFVQCHLPSKVRLIKFLGFIWSCSTSRVLHIDSCTVSCPAVLQRHSLQIGCICLGSLDKQDLKNMSSYTPTAVLSLLVPLCNPVPALREGAVACLNSLQSRSTSTLPPPVGAIVSLLIESTEELEADHEHLHRILASTFGCLSESSSKNKSKISSEEKKLIAMLECIVRQTVSEETPSYVQRIVLMALSDVVTQPLLQLCLPRLEVLIAKSKTNGLTVDENCCLNLLIKKLSPVTADMLEYEPITWDLVQKIFGLRSSVCPGHPPPAATLLDQITDVFFQAISSKQVAQDIVAVLLDMLLETKNMLLINKAKDTLAQVTLTADNVVVELCKLTTHQNRKTPKKKKLKRNIVLEDSVTDEMLAWQRVTIILELLQHKVNVSDEHQLIPTLFAILSRCVEMDDSLPVNCDYIKQLILDEILNIFQRVTNKVTPITKDVLPEDQFNVELIVQCIRVSDNPQTHHHALLLLAAAAKCFPEKVLHNVMSIFTFMGANVLRQDDSYSFQVISKTVETVIPALIQAGERQKITSIKGAPSVSVDDVVAMVIRVFVDASPHVPEHRRLPVFSHLVTTVGASRFLHVTLTLLLEKYIVHSSEPEEEEGSLQSPLDLEFCLGLCHEFEPDVQAEGMLKLLNFVTQLPAEKPEVGQRLRAGRRSTSLFTANPALFDVQSHTAKHLRQFKFITIGFLPTVLSSDGFVSKLAELGSQTKNTMEKTYLSLIEELLTFVTVTAQYAEGHTQGTTGKFWRALLHKTYDIIDKVNQLLPADVFISVVRRLLQNSYTTVRRKAMELLNTKLAHNKVIQEQEEELSHLVEDLLSLVQAPDGSETPVNRQTALYSLKLLARLLAERQANTFTKVLAVCIEIFTRKDENTQVVCNAVLCAGEVCAGLKANTISHLPQLMPGLLHLLKKSGKERNALLLLCAVVTLHKVTETLPNFLSPYMKKILIRVTCPSLNNVASTEEEPRDKDSPLNVQLQNRLAVLRKEIARVVTPRVLIPAVSLCYDDVVDTRHVAVPLLMDIVCESVTCMEKRDIASHHEQLFKFFLGTLDFRVTQPQCEPDLLDQVENDVINAFCSLVMKMSEASFRPVFLKLVDWATRGNADRDRLLVFYRLCNSVADKLKGLIVLFAGYIISNCASLLDANNIAKTDEVFYAIKDPKDHETADHKKSCLLINYILDCLHKCLLYATRGFVDKERFNCLMQPIVDQLENQVGGSSEFQDRVSNHLVPCLAQLAVAAGSDADWKLLNYQILLKTRHSSSQVRFAALQALEEIYRQLGEEFLVVLLPESIPFLAELMEDECVEVEQQCQHVIQQIETIIGEPLQKYFES